jgi:hypothetical protein
MQPRREEIRAIAIVLFRTWWSQKYDPVIVYRWPEAVATKEKKKKKEEE